MPVSMIDRKKKTLGSPRVDMVGTGGFEPPTPAVSGRCSPTELRAFSGSGFNLIGDGVNLSAWIDVRTGAKDGE